MFIQQNEYLYNELNKIRNWNKFADSLLINLNKYGGLSQEETKNLIPSVDEFMNPPSDNDNPFEYNDSKVISYDDYWCDVGSFESLYNH